LLNLPVRALLAADAGPTVDDLLELKAAQAEQAETFDAILSTEVSSDAATATAKTVSLRLSYDKSLGAMRIQGLDAAAGTAVLVKGASVQMKRPDGQWSTLSLDAQTRGTLEELGVDLDALPASQRGLAGEPKVKRLRDLSKAQADAERRKRGQARVKRWKDRFNHSRLATLDRNEPNGRRSRALLLRSKAGKGEPAFDGKLEWVDEASGLVLESSLMLEPQRFQRHFGAQAAKDLQRRRKARLDDGRELVEIGSTRLTKVFEKQGLSLPEESESVNSTAHGEVRQKTRWSEVRANEDLDPTLFEAR
jgi:hypothetical protein